MQPSCPIHALTQQSTQRSSIPANHRGPARDIIESFYGQGFMFLSRIHRVLIPRTSGGLVYEVSEETIHDKSMGSGKPETQNPKTLNPM